MDLVVDHREAVVRKLARLRELGAEEELERRWEEESDEEDDLYNGGCLFLPAGGVQVVELSPDESSVPELRELYRLSDGPDFGRVKCRGLANSYRTKAVDYLGEPIHEGTWQVIADVGEGVQALLDPATDHVTVYDFLYFKYGEESGVCLECGSVFEFIDTVALGSRYRDLLGSDQSKWWVTDPWWKYLVEIGFASA